VSAKKSSGKKSPARPARPAAKVSAAKVKTHAATAASILGRPIAKSGVIAPRNGAGPIKIKSEWQKYYTTLMDLRERLVAQMNGLAKESAEEMAGYSLHMADSGTDNFDRDFALSLLSSDQDAMYEIEEALKRIEKNTYGICELTGKQIPRARLEAIPWTRFTVEAQAQLERDGALRQRRLGALGTVDSVGSSDVESGGDDEEPEEKAKEKE
jgi:DnaK suppressor protein